MLAPAQASEWVRVSVELVPVEWDPALVSAPELALVEQDLARAAALLPS